MKMKRYSAANKHQAKLLVQTIKTFGLKAEIDPTRKATFYYEPKAFPILEEIVLIMHG